jgi:folate-binding protein YgfZ
MTVNVRVLEERSLLAIVGDDTRSWLSGQVTNEVRSLPLGETVYALVLNLSGKIIADVFILAETEERFLLNVPASEREMLIAHFDKFIIMEDVELEPEDSATLALSGEESANISLPDGKAPAWDWLGDGGRSWIGDPAELKSALGDSISWQTESEWELERLRAQRQRYGIDFGVFTLPQEADLKERAVSFNKGCYQGQEAVVMLEHRGKVPKMLVSLSIEAKEAPELDSPIETADGVKVGMVRSASFDADLNAVRAFGYLKRQHLGTKDILRIAGCDARLL